MKLAVGDVYKGFLKVEAIKRGALGVIYVCVLTSRDEESSDEEKDRRVIKTVSTDFYERRDNRERFDQEALLWNSVPPHPYIITCEMVDRGESVPMIVLEYAAGGTLREFIAGGALSLGSALMLFRQACVGMEFLYDNAGVVHRDIKPDNLMLSAAGDLKITDFGLASIQTYALELLASQDRDRDFASRPGQRFVGGTLPYMSPEHFGEAEVTVRSDLYSFGAVMFETVERRLVFDRRSSAAYRNAHLHDKPPRLSASNGPGELADIIAKCLDKDPSRRFASFSELDDALAEIARKYLSEVEEPLRPSLQELEARIDAAGWNRRGYAFGKLRRFEDSLTCYERAWKLAPDSMAANVNMGSALERVGRVDEALPYFEREVELHGEQPLNRVALSSTYARRGRFDDAVREMEAAVALSTDLYALRQLCLLYRWAGRQQEAEEAFARLREASVSSTNRMYSSASIWVNEGLHCALAGELDFAMWFFEEATSRFPESVDGWYNRAVTEVFLGRPDDASTSLQQAIRQDQDLIYAHFLLGLLGLARGDVYAALNEWQEVQRLQEGHFLGELIRRAVAMAVEQPISAVITTVLRTLGPQGLYHRT